MRKAALLTAVLLMSTACNLSQITDSSGPDKVTSSEGIGSGWTGGSASHGSGGDNGNGDANPLVGEWRFTNASCASPAAVLTLGGDRSGSIYLADCTGNCPSGVVNDFNWTNTGTSAGTLTLNYTGAQICGQVVDTPGPDSAPYSFSGPYLEYGGHTWTRSGSG